MAKKENGVEMVAITFLVPRNEVDVSIDKDTGEKYYNVPFYLEGTFGNNGKKAILKGRKLILPVNARKEPAAKDKVKTVPKEVNDL